MYIYVLCIVSIHFMVVCGCALDVESSLRTDDYVYMIEINIAGKIFFKQSSFCAMRRNE